MFWVFASSRIDSSSTLSLGRGCRLQVAGCRCLLISFSSSSFGYGKFTV